MEYRILLIEESAHLRHQYAQTLFDESQVAGLAFQIMTVSSIAAGQLQAVRHHFDAVIAPLRSDNEGILLTQNLREVRSHMQVVLLHDRSVSSLQLSLARHLGALAMPHPDNPGDLFGTMLTALGIHLNHHQLVGQVLNTQQQSQVDAIVAQFVAQDGIRYALVADLNGQPVATASNVGEVHTNDVAALAAGNLQATVSLAREFGGQRSSSLMIHEHPDQTVLFARIADQMLLMVSVKLERPLGMTRIELKRAAQQIALIAQPVAAMLTMPVEVQDRLTARSVGETLPVPRKD
jgi:predicted regulator of Ras-like GTPase activity (Roadblock/LC7/MglB family)